MSLPSDGLGPFAIVESESADSSWAPAEGLVAAALVESGPLDADAQRLLRQWWEAALDTTARAKPGAHCFDVGPARFSVSHGGKWHYSQPGVVFRFRLAPEVLALRGLADMFQRRLAHAPIPGISGDLPVRDALAAMLGICGLKLDDATIRLWAEVEADFRTRFTDDAQPAHDARSSLIAQMNAPLYGHYDLGARATYLERALGEAREHVTRLEQSLESAAQALESERRAGAQVGDLNRRLGQLEEQLRVAIGRAVQAEALAREQAARADAQMARAERAEADSAASVAWNSPRRWWRSRARDVLASLPGARLLVPNPLFDNRWYREQYPDVQSYRLGGYLHFRRRGRFEGRRPNALFDTEWYLDNYADVRASRMNALDHYLRFGVREGRNPGPGFDTAWYLRQNPDVAAAGINPLLHYLRHGMAERRQPLPPDRPAG